MNKTDDLFELIKSMSKAEKRHFKLSAGSFGSQQNYLRLYNALENQESYNEKNIKSLFKGETFIKQLHVTKNYLYNLILKSLKAFHAENSSKHILRELLNDYEILFQKKLYRQSDKLLRRAKKMATDYESFYYMLEILDKEEYRLRITNDVKKLETELNTIYKNRNTILENIKNNFTYKKLSSEMLVISHNTGVTRKKEAIENYKRIIQLPEMKSPTLATTDTATGFYHQVLSSCFYYTHNYKKAYYHLLEQKKFIESSPIRKKKFMGEYISVLGNMLSLGQVVLPFEKMIELLSSFKKIISEAPKETERILQPYYVITIDVYSKHGDFRGLIPIIKEAEDWMSKIKTIRRADNYDILLYQKFAYAYFGLGKLKESLRWLNKALNVPEKENIKIDIYPFLMLFNLILHYELNNIELLPYITRSTFRYLSKKEKIFRFEKIILTFIKNTSLEFKNKHEQRTEFLKLRKQLSELRNNNYEKQPFDNFDFISWLDSKVEGLSFEEAVKKNRRRNYNLNP